LFPILTVLRFLIAGPVALLVPPLQAYLERHATSLAMNSEFVRDVGPAEHRVMVRHQAGLLLFWTPFVILFWQGVLTPRVAMSWLVVATAISLVNGIRTLAAHRYLANGASMDRVGQHADSIDIPGAWWTALWAPVGHRYHAVHHYAPWLPYHNLAAAYHRLVTVQDKAQMFRASTSSGLGASLLRLWSRAGQDA